MDSLSVIDRISKLVIIIMVKLFLSEICNSPFFRRLNLIAPQTLDFFEKFASINFIQYGFFYQDKQLSSGHNSFLTKQNIIKLELK